MKVKIINKFNDRVEVGEIYEVQPHKHQPFRYHLISRVPDGHNPHTCANARDIETVKDGE